MDLLDGWMRMIAYEWLVCGILCVLSVGSYHQLFAVQALNSSKLIPLVSIASDHSLGQKFFVACGPGTQHMEDLLKVIYELYMDYVLKNPFCEMEMPIRCFVGAMNFPGFCFNNFCYFSLSFAFSTHIYRK